MGNTLNIRALQTIATENHCTPTEMLKKMQSDGLEGATLRAQYNVTLEQVNVFQKQLASGEAYAVGDVISFTQEGVNFKVPWDFDVDLPIHDEKTKAKYDRLYTENNVIMGVPKDGGKPVEVANFSQQVENMKVQAMMDQLEAKKFDIAKEIETNEAYIKASEKVMVGAGAAAAVLTGGLILAEYGSIEAAFTAAASRLGFTKEAVAGAVEWLMGEVSRVATNGYVTKPALTYLVSRALVACKDGGTQNYDLSTTAQQNTTMPLSVNIKNDFSSLEAIGKAILEKLNQMDDKRANEAKELLNKIKEYSMNTTSNLTTITGLVVELLNLVASDRDLLNIIIQQIGSNNELIGIVIDKLDDNNALLADIRNLIEQNHNDDKDYQKKMLALMADVKASIATLNSSVRAGFEATIKAICKSNASLDDIKKMIAQLNANIEKLNTLVEKYGDKGEKLGNAILAAIGKLDFNTTVDLSGIEALLARIADSTEKNGDKIDNLTALFNKFSGDNAAQLNEIIKNQKLNGAKLDTIISLMTKMDANNEKRTKLILDAIKANGFNVAAYLDKVIENQETMISINDNGFKAVLDAIKALTAVVGKIDTSVIEALLKDIKAGVKNNGDLLTTITKQNDTIISLIKGLGTKIDGINAWLAAIHNKLPEGGQGGCKLDFDKLMAKLDEILNAIKDHKVEVDVTGKITCTCDCKCGKHEGILGNLNDLLG